MSTWFGALMTSIGTAVFFNWIYVIKHWMEFMSMYVSKEKEWDIYYERKGEELNITSSYG